MEEYAEIEAPKELLYHCASLTKALRPAMPIKQRRTIGYPAGSFICDVRFTSADGENVFWWATRLSDDKASRQNYFGHGNPSEQSLLNIDVQFNVPIKDFSRRLGGAFLRQLSTGTIILARRGIVTLGYGRVNKVSLFAEM